MKRILFIDTSRPSSSSGVGGSLFSMMNIVSHLNRSKYDPFVILYYDLPLVDDFCKKMNVQYESLTFVSSKKISNRKGGKFTIRVPFKKWLSVFKHRGRINYIRDYIRNHEIDILHANNRINANLECLIAAKTTKTSYIQHQRYYDKNIDLGTKLLIKGVPIVCISSSIKHNVDLLVGDIDSNYLIHNWVTLSTSYTNQDKEKTKILWIGRIVPWKGIEKLIQLLVLNPNLTLTVDVYGEFDSNSYKDEIKQKIQENGLAGKIVFKGFIQFKDIDFSPYLCYIHTSVKPEPFGRTLIESMQAGVPVFATSMGGALDIIVNDHSGWLYDSENIGSVSSKLLSLKDNHALRSKIISNAKDRVNKHFSGVEQIKEIEKIYDSQA